MLSAQGTGSFSIVYDREESEDEAGDRLIPNHRVCSVDVDLQ